MITSISGCWPSSSKLSRSYLCSEIFLPNDSYGASSNLATSFRSFFVAPKHASNDACQIPLQIAASSSEQTADKSSLLLKIVEYLSLSDDWDGYGGKAANLATVMDTFDFLKRYPSTFPTPKPMIGGSGAIGLYWEDNACYASIEFDGSGCYCYIADRPGDSCRGERVPVSDALPRQLSEVLSLIAVPRRPRLLPDDPAGNAAFASLLERMPDAGQDDDFERLDETTAPCDVFD